MATFQSVFKIILLSLAVYFAAPHLQKIINRPYNTSFCQNFGVEIKMAWLSFVFAAVVFVLVLWSEWYNNRKADRERRKTRSDITAILSILRGEDKQNTEQQREVLEQGKPKKQLTNVNSVVTGIAAIAALVIGLVLLKKGGRDATKTKEAKQKHKEKEKSGKTQDN